jgi:hypothetical protein
MNHISDHILEVYALNRHALSRKVQDEVYSHIASCSECRQVLSHLCHIWKKDLHLVFEPVNDFDLPKKVVEPNQQTISTDLDQSLDVLGYFVTSSSQKKLRVTRSLTDLNWFVDIHSEVEDTDLLFLTKFSFKSDWIVLKGHESTDISNKDVDLTSSTAVFKVSQDVIVPEDDYMIRANQRSIILDTHRVELNTAFLENPESIYSTLHSSSGIFKIPLNYWTKQSRLHLFSV